MHGAPGCQNSDWHCDSTGDVRLFDSPWAQDLLTGLWRKIAQRYKDYSIIAGYDILNEAVTEKTRALNKLYQRIISTIRGQGDQHIIFLEGNNWGSDLEFLDEFDDPHIVYSIHFYHPIQITFNVAPNLVYPGNIDGERWDRARLEGELRRYYAYARKRNRPVYVGEFGVAIKCPSCNQELTWLKDIISIFEKFNFHWTYWTYKAVGFPFLPNGIYQIFDNTIWIRRFNYLFGWEKFPSYLREKKENKNVLLDTLKTQHFIRNEKIVAILRKPLKISI